MKKKFAILMSHPIQYQAPLLKRIASHEDIDLHVYFFWDFGVRPTVDPEFKKEVKWDMPILDGYKYTFIKNYAVKPSSSFFGQLGFGIIKEIIQKKYDSILIFGWNSFPNWCVLLLAPFIKSKIILSGESPLSHEMRKKRWKIILKKILLWYMSRVISAFMYIGSENKKFYEFFGVLPKKLFFMPYAVDNDRLLNSFEKLKNQRDEFRKEFSADERPIILFVGKLFSKKRPMDLLRAFEYVKKNSRTTPILVFVGDGDGRDELENYVKKNDICDVHFVGFKNQTELPRYYIAADIFVLPSGMGETWGLVVNEAMCFGLPVVVSDLVGCGADLVKNGENGFIFGCGDSNALGVVLLKLVDDSDLRKRFGLLSKKIIQAYSHSEDVSSLVSVLKTKV